MSYLADDIKEAWRVGNSWKISSGSFHRHSVLFSPSDDKPKQSFLQVL